MLARAVPTALLALALLAPASAGARPADHLWATVNVCDTAKAPDTLGVRGRMPGNGSHQRMFMRFRAQFYSGSEFRWKYVTKGGTSPWIEVGSARFAFKETGYEFSFDAPAAGTTFMLRGVAEFQWRAKHNHGGKVVTTVARHTRKFTEAGHRTRDADPKGFSAARCELKP
ncbi:MAG: hypothetical protein QOJ07_3507 [Thermoleophilaceae bacterium]|jgi:hypothetical protein|nr:hypothetical protein [Thermoleophilaceae bacterium]